MPVKKSIGATRAQVVGALETLAPLDHAESWDNVGLLWAPTRAKRIERILLTIDCTPEVAVEAISERIDFIVSYHPPLFHGVNRFVLSDPLDHRLLKLIEARIAVYAPHTALDHAPGGVNEWLAERVLGCRPGVIEIETGHAARQVVFDQPVSAQRLLCELRTALRIPYLRVAEPIGRRRPLRRIAVCAGAGIETLRPLKADAFLTGEMKHHDILASVARGITVILSEHTHTERGYLPVLRKGLSRLLPGVDVALAKSDREPVRLYRSGAVSIAR